MSWLTDFVDAIVLFPEVVVELVDEYRRGLEIFLEREKLLNKIVSLTHEGAYEYERVVLRIARHYTYPEKAIWRAGLDLAHSRAIRGDSIFPVNTVRDFHRWGNELWEHLPEDIRHRDILGRLQLLKDNAHLEWGRYYEHLRSDP